MSDVSDMKSIDQVIGEIGPDQLIVSWGKNKVATVVNNVDTPGRVANALEMFVDVFRQIQREELIASLTEKVLEDPAVAELDAMIGANAQIVN